MDALKDVKVTLEFSPYELDLMLGGLAAVQWPGAVWKLQNSIMDKIEKARAPFVAKMQQEAAAMQHGGNGKAAPSKVV